MSHKTDINGLYMMLVINIEDVFFFIICNLDGYNISSQNKEPLSTICTAESMKILYPTDYILVGGDFNMTPDDWKDRNLSRFDTHHFNNTVMDSFVTH